MAVARKPPRELQNEIAAQLRWDDRVDAGDIRVEVTNGRVALTGTVPSLSDSQAAEAAACAIPGVAAVVNRLEVRFPPGVERPPGPEIAAAVRDVFRRSDILDETRITVEVAGGVVILEGTVDFYWQKFRAADLASAMAGATGVDNRLAVTPRRRIGDEDIRKDIREALARSEHIDAHLLEIEVLNGVVILRGTIEDRYMANQARALAANSPGVIDVVDDMSPRGAAYGETG